MKVNIDEDWKYITTLSHTTGGSKLFVANWLSGVTIYTPEMMKIKTLSIYRDYIFLGMEYGAVIRQNLKDLKGTRRIIPYVPDARNLYLEFPRASK